MKSTVRLGILGPLLCCVVIAIFGSELPKAQAQSSYVWQQVTKRTKPQVTKFGYFTTTTNPFNSRTTPGLRTGGEGWQLIKWLSYAPSNPNIVYMVIDTNQVWKSTDGGTTWQRKGNCPAKGGFSITVHPTNENIAYLAASLFISGVHTSEGIFRTTDGGESWTYVKQAHFHEPNDHGNKITFAGATLYAAPSTGGVLKSTDGISWNLLNKSGGGYVLDTLNLIEIKVHPANNTILFVTASDGLYKIVDGG